MQFCGQMPFCTAFNSRQAMEEAKKNVEVSFQVVGVVTIVILNTTIIVIIIMKVSYPVVGVVELWDETLEVLEHKLPAFFKGAMEMYAKKKKEV